MTILRNLLFGSTRFYWAMQICLALIFIAAGALKLTNPRAFARVISAYDLVPQEFLVPVAIGLPTLELLAGLGLLFNIRGCCKVIFSLLAGFLALLAYAILNGMDVDCGCFSSEEIHARNALQTAFLRDLGLLVLSVYLLSWQWIRERLVPVAHRHE